MTAFRSKTRFGLTLLFLAMASITLPSLLPLCQAQAAVRMAHPCCRGGQTCHAQVRRVPCCEFQRSGPSSSAVPLSKSGSDAVAILPSAGAVLQFLLNPPPVQRWAFDVSAQAQAPPLYLSKQSLLC